jgi:hypothetical protein
LSEKPFFDNLRKRASSEIGSGVGTLLASLDSEKKLGWDCQQSQGVGVSKDGLTVFKTASTGFGGAVGAQLYSTGETIFLSTLNREQQRCELFFEVVET